MNSVQIDPPCQNASWYAGNDGDFGYICLHIHGRKHDTQLQEAISCGWSIVHNIRWMFHNVYSRISPSFLAGYSVTFLW